MKKNVGVADRIVRFIVAVVFAYLIFTNAVGGALLLVLGVFGGIFLLTAVSGFCPIYLLLGIKSNSTEHHHSAH
jgi:hypothetical protein